MPDHIIDYVSKRQIPQQQFSTLEEALPDTDVLYMTRIQRERFTSEEEYKQVSCRNAESKRAGLSRHFSIVYKTRLANLFLIADDNVSSGGKLEYCSESNYLLKWRQIVKLPYGMVFLVRENCGCNHETQK